MGDPFKNMLSKPQSGWLKKIKPSKDKPRVEKSSRGWKVLR